METAKGTLYLVPAPLSDAQEAFLLEPDKRLISSLKYFIVETPKKARAHLKKLNLTSKLFELDIQTYNENTDRSQIPELLKPLFEGQNIGYMSDAGLPAVADPGSELIYLAHRNEIKVVPLIGGSSLMLALMASGLNGQRFAFKGYLPILQDKKQAAIRDLERIAVNYNETQIFMDTPYRAHYMLRDILAICKDKTLLSVAVDLYTPDQMIVTKNVGEWKDSQIDLNKRQVLFLLGKAKS